MIIEVENITNELIKKSRKLIDRQKYLEQRLDERKITKRQIEELFINYYQFGKEFTVYVWDTYKKKLRSTTKL